MQLSGNEKSNTVLPPKFFFFNLITRAVWQNLNAFSSLCDIQALMTEKHARIKKVRNIKKISNTFKTNEIWKDYFWLFHRQNPLS